MEVLLPPTSKIIVNLKEKSLLTDTPHPTPPPPKFIKEYQEHISFAEILTLSQLAGIGDHRAID